MGSLFQDFEADFLWKASLKILNSGIILKPFTHARPDSPVMLNILCTTFLPNSYFCFNMQHSSCKHVSIRLENDVDPDQMALSEAS